MAAIEKPLERNLPAMAMAALLVVPLFLPFMITVKNEVYTYIMGYNEIVTQLTAPIAVAAAIATLFRNRYAWYFAQMCGGLAILGAFRVLTGRTISMSLVYPGLGMYLVIAGAAGLLWFTRMYRPRD